MFYLTRFIY